MSKPKCQVCGGLEFTLDAGFYYCSECQTQSQEIREFVFDEYFAGKKAVTRVLKTTAADKLTKEAAVTLTSWEIFNYILKGLVDEIMELGAKREVKIVTLQLWASYLRRLEVAFMSTSVPHKPRLDINFRSEDAEIVYGVTTKLMKQSDALLKLRSRSRTTLASSRSSSASSVDTVTSISDADISRRSYLRKLSAKKKALALAEYQNISQGSTQNSSLGEFGTAHASSRKPCRVKLTKHARCLLKNKTKFKNKLDEGNREQLKKICRNESGRTITVAKLVALLRLALLLTDQGMYTSDIFRWIAEGHLSVLNRRVFLPKEAIVKGELKRILQVKAWSSQGQKSCLFQLCKLLDISSIPVPNLITLATRYCKELQLPDDFTMAVCNSVTMLPMKTFTPTTNYEVVTMGVIVVLLKMLFSLDGKTEHHMSELAKEVGRSTSLPLFVWDNWVEYIECRKEVVAMHHYPTHLTVYGDTLPAIDPQLFFMYQQFIKRGKKPGGEEEMAKTYGRETKANKIWVNQLKRWLDKLNTSSDHQYEPVQFPASLTPFYTYTQILLNEYPQLLFEEAKTTLSQDFTKHSVDYIFRPQRFISKMVHFGIKIAMHSGPAVNFNEGPVDFNKVFVPRTRINKEMVCVRLIVEKQNKEKNKNKSYKNDKSNTETESNILDDDLISDTSSVDEDDGDAKVKNRVREDDLEKPMQFVDSAEKGTKTKKIYTLYVVRNKLWHIDVPLKRMRISNKEFEAKATEMFPLSFLWLLRECARMISVSIRELYAAIMSFEKVIKDFDSQTQKFKCK